MHRDTIILQTVKQRWLWICTSLKPECINCAQGQQGKNVQAQDGRSANSTATLSARKASSQQRHLGRVSLNTLVLATPVCIVQSLPRPGSSISKQRPLPPSRVVSAFLSRRREVDKTENNNGHEREGLPEHPALCSHVFSGQWEGVWKRERQLEGSKTKRKRRINDEATA